MNDPDKLVSWDVVLDCGHQGGYAIPLGSRRHPKKMPCFRCRDYAERRIVSRKKVDPIDNEHFMVEVESRVTEVLDMESRVKESGTLTSTDLQLVLGHLRWLQASASASYRPDSDLEAKMEQFERLCQELREQGR